MHYTFYKLLRDYLFFEDSLFLRLIIIPSFFITIFFLFIFIFDNPFSSFGANDEVIVHEKINLEDVREHLNKKKHVNKKAYFFDIVDRTQVEIKSQEGITIHIARIDGKPSNKNGSRTVEQLQKISSHPIKPFKITENNSLLLFGTMGSGYDFLSVLAKNGKRSFTLVLYTIISFLFSGMFMGIIDGYFNEISRSILIKTFHKLIKGFQNMIESTPLLLWILLSIIFIESIFIYMNEDKIQNLTFLMFGFFSSPALAKLLSNKIKELKAEEFIAALKLQGVSNLRIIFIHIIRYYCLPIISYQVCYIIAQALFLDISLNILQFNFLNGLGSIIYPLFTNNSQNMIQLIVVVSMMYAFIITLYNFAKFSQNKGI